MPIHQKHGFTSALRYPGGKGSLANYVKMVIAENGLLDGDYVEVYAGGAGIAWPLLFEEYVRRVHINDLDETVTAFWDAVLNHTDELCRMICDTKVTLDERARQRAVQDCPGEHSIIEVAFSTFFLNRTSRSGILRGGVIGGKRQDGTWKLDARFNKPDLIHRIQRVAGYRGRIQVYNKDAADFISKVIPRFPPRTLVYLDPPYFYKGQELYKNFYTPGDHAEIARLVHTRISHPWLVSYDVSPEILALYKQNRATQYQLHYSAQNHYAGSEVIFHSPKVVVPAVDSPIRVRSPHHRMSARLGAPATI